MMQEYHEKQRRERVNAWNRTRPKKPPKRYPFFIGILVVTALYLITRDARAQDINQYTPLNMGMCKDVELRCAVMIHKDTPIYYAIFSDDGNLVAITKAEVGKPEETVWGKLPLKKGEKEI